MTIESVIAGKRSHYLFLAVRIPFFLQCQFFEIDSIQTIEQKSANREMGKSWALCPSTCKKMLRAGVRLSNTSDVYQSSTPIWNGFHLHLQASWNDMIQNRYLIFQGVNFYHRFQGNFQACVRRIKIFKGAKIWALRYNVRHTLADVPNSRIVAEQRTALEVTSERMNDTRSGELLWSYPEVVPH